MADIRWASGVIHRVCEIAGECHGKAPPRQAFDSKRAMQHAHVEMHSHIQKLCYLPGVQQAENLLVVSADRIAIPYLDGGMLAGPDCFRICFASV